MSFKRYLDKIKFIDSLIGKKATGSQKELAARLGLSVSTINEYLNEMKDAGFPIKYCNKRRTYYYERDGKMVKSLFEEALSLDQMRKIEGGKMYAVHTTELISLKHFILRRPVKTNQDTAIA